MACRRDRHQWPMVPKALVVGTERILGVALYWLSPIAAEPCYPRPAFIGLSWIFAMTYDYVTRLASDTCDGAFHNGGGVTRISVTPGAPPVQSDAVRRPLHVEQGVLRRQLARLRCARLRPRCPHRDGTLHSHPSPPPRFLDRPLSGPGLELVGDRQPHLAHV